MLVGGQTLPKDRFGEDLRSEDMWAREDTSRRQVRRTYSPSRRHVGDIEQRQPQPRGAVCFELQVVSVCCSQWHDLTFPRCGLHPTPAQSSRWFTRRARARVNPPCPEWRRERVVEFSARRHLKAVSKRGAARSRVAPVAHVGVSVKTWRHLPTWRQGAGGVARCGVKMWRLYQGSRHWPHLASQDVASERGVTCSCGVREPWGVAGRGVRPSTYVASQDVASIPGVRRPRPPATCLQNVSSVIGRYVRPP